jgi:AcrR family transcriptional regulator
MSGAAPLPDPIDPDPPRRTRSRKRFERKRELILDAATDLINERGIKGTTFLDLAAMVELNTTSVTYYFRRKEDLAAAVFEQTLDRLETMAADAAGEPTPRCRVKRFLGDHIALRARALRGEERPLTVLSDIRTLDEPVRDALEKHFQAIFRQVRGFFGPARDARHKALLTARAHMLFEVVFWLPAWLDHYALVDFPRVHARLFELLDHGIALADAGWSPALFPGLDARGMPQAESGPAIFLHVATRLINDAGYRGASVDRIVGELKVTKGSFYHHLEAKDDLVMECFRQSYRRVSLAQSLADDAGGDGWKRLSSTIATLLDIQFEAEWPLLRTTALQSLPTGLRADVVERSNRMALRFAGTIVDGVAESSLRPVDPMIASQLIMATLNAAYDLRKWASALDRNEAIALYSSTLARGLFDD